MDSLFPLDFVYNIPMKQVFKLLRFVRPYWKKCVVALVFLVIVFILDLAILRLVQRIIDQGSIHQNSSVVLNTFLLMLVISIANTLFAIVHNHLSIQAS